MAPRLRPCPCTPNALISFIYRVACIDIVSAIHSSVNNVRVLSSARYHSSTLHPLQTQDSSQHKIDGSIQGSTVSKRKQRLFELSDYVASEGKWALGGSAKEMCTPSVLGIAHHHEDVPAILEFTLEAIDTLAAGSIENNVYCSPSARNPVGATKPNGFQNSRKGFALHYSAPATVPPLKTRSLSKSTSRSPRPQIVKSMNEAQHRVIVTERKPWQTQKESLKEKFEDGWNPRKKLSPDALAGIRAIHAQFPEQYTTSILAEKFEVSPEAIRRILKSRWTPKEEEVLDRQRRWFLRGQKVWSHYAELGLKPPKRWRKLGIGKRSDTTVARENRQGMDTKITVRGVNQAVSKPGKSLSSVSVTMADSIL